MSIQKKNRFGNTSDDRLNRTKTIKGIVQRIKKSVREHAAQAMKLRESKLREIKKSLRKRRGSKTIESGSEETQK